MAETLTIDVVSDVVCPWCYLGKRRLERALTLVPDLAVEVRWRPFQLDPTIPPEGIDRRAYIEKKFGIAGSVTPTHERLTEMGVDEGIDYHFERIKRSPNTIDAHRLIHWAGSEREEEAVERLFRAYFTEGRNIGDPAVLAELAGDIGMETGDIEARLSTDEDRTVVEQEIAEANRIGVTGVPCFIVGGRYAVGGAQSPDTIAEAIQAVLQEQAGAAASSN
jgi:predicted DsbA family dithiol-disulfide isomerase